MQRHQSENTRAIGLSASFLRFTPRATSALPVCRPRAVPPVHKKHRSSKLVQLPAPADVSVPAWMRSEQGRASEGTISKSSN